MFVPQLEATPSSLPTAAPGRADLKVGFACNNRCVFCAQGEKRRECKALPLDVLEDRLRVARTRADTLVLTGGEPTMHRDLLRLVHKARELGFRVVQIQTNGRMLSYPGTVKRLLEAGATEFSPSLHGSTAAIHEGLTLAPGSWRQSVEGIRQLVRAHAPLITNSVMTRSNVHDLPRLVSLLGHLGVWQAQLAFVHPVGTAMEKFEEVVPRMTDVVAALRRCREVARGYGMRLATEAMPYCCLEGMEELCVEERIPQTSVLDLDGKPADYTHWRTIEGKSHGASCEACSERSRCEGPWREYPERYGWDEFRPVVAKHLNVVAS